MSVCPVRRAAAVAAAAAAAAAAASGVGTKVMLKNVFKSIVESKAAGGVKMEQGDSIKDFIMSFVSLSHHFVRIITFYVVTLAMTRLCMCCEIVMLCCVYVCMCICV
jgi:hypothetical protein